LQGQKDGIPSPGDVRETDPYERSYDGKSALRVTFWYQYLPGPAGAKIPPPEQRGSATLRFFVAERGKAVGKPLAVQKDTGRYLLKAGEYSIEITRKEQGDGGHQLITIRQGKTLNLKIWAFDAAP
jgi:hypothetical protein